jgi:hypothetical protein
MSRERKAGHLGQRVAVVPQDVDISVDEVSYVQVMPIGTKRDPFGEAAHVGLGHLMDRLSIDLEERHIGFP